MENNQPEQPKPDKEPWGRRQNYTIENLRLNLDAARAGRTWEVLPDGFREREHGEKSYPLPSQRHELQLLASMYSPRSGRARDGGEAYLRRARKALKSREKMSATFHGKATPELNVHQAADAMRQHLHREREIHKGLRAEAERAVDELKAVAAQHIAGLDNLFELGRKGIDGMMQAHLNGQDWQGERITAQAFRQCFRMVTQAVKGLGIPSDQSEPANRAIMEERVAAALKDTQDAISLAPNSQSDEVN